MRFEHTCITEEKIKMREFGQLYEICDPEIKQNKI